MSGPDSIFGFPPNGQGWIHNPEIYSRWLQAGKKEKRKNKKRVKILKK